MRRLRQTALAFAVTATLAGGASARAQAAVTADDLARLETAAAAIDQQTVVLKHTDATLAADVAKALAALRDEVTYLKVKLRRDGTVTRAEYGDVRDRLETLRIRAQGQKVTAQPMLGDPTGRVWSVPIGVELDVRLLTALNSGTAEVDTRFDATTVADLKMGANEVVIPAGTLVRGFVSSVRAAGKVDRRGSLTLSFDELVIGRQSVRLRASVEQAIDSKQGEDLTRMSAAGPVGAIVGGTLGGGRAALVGVLVGVGGTMVSTEGSDIDLPAGTILRLRIDQPIEISVGG